MMKPQYKSQDALDRQSGIPTLMKIFGRFLRLLLPYWDKMLLWLIVNQIGAFVNLIPALLGIRIIDEVFPQRNWGLGVTLVWANFTISYLIYFIYLSNNYVWAWIRMFVGYRIQFGFLRHLQQLSITFYESRPVGEHMQRATGDPAVVEAIIVDTIPNAIGPFQRLFASVTVIATIKPELAWMALVYIIPYLIGQHLFTTWFRNLSKMQLARGQENTARLIELLSAFKTTRALNREATERRKYWVTWSRCKRMDWRVWWVTALQQNTLDNYAGIFTTVAIPLFTIYWVIGDKMTIGEYGAAGWIVGQFLNPIQALAGFFQGIRRQLVNAERLLDTLEVEPDMVDEKHARNLPAKITGRIKMENVSYAYPGGGPVLRNISLTIEPGQKAAIVGPSGAGKSTLLGMLCRFYNPAEGRVSIDGYDLRNVTRPSLMQHIGVCLQDTLILMGTIGENIWYGGLDPSREEIEAAAKLAGIHDFIMTLPEGYNTVLAESGQLSGGQKQRIGLARVLVRDPRIILFDEITSAMDPLLHHEVIDSLRECCKGRTVAMISHNLLDVRDADVIFVINSHGEMAQQGKHEDLMAVPGLYQQLWRREELDRELGDKGGETPSPAAQNPSNEATELS
jgi:ABC-type multidrug transport system fused ATPase/permease subunit